MDRRSNAILIHESDDVATAIVELCNGDGGRYRKQAEVVQIVIREDIPKFHKFAVRDIRKSEFVRKYGEIIGEAVQDIGKGCHVHEHNIISPQQRERRTESE